MKIAIYRLKIRELLLFYKKGSHEFLITLEFFLPPPFPTLYKIVMSPSDMKDEREFGGWIESRPEDYIMSIIRNP